MPHAEVNGTRLYYEIRGQGIPLLIMHGGLGLDHSLYPSIFEPLESQFQFIYYDMRDHGRSDRSEHVSFTYEQLADDADALREYLGFEKINVLGHSAGGWIAQVYAQRHPDRLNRLILYHTGLENPANYSQELNGLAQKANDRHPTFAARAEQFHEGFEMRTDDDFRDSLFHILFRYFYRYSQELDDRFRGAMDNMIVNGSAFMHDVSIRADFDMRPVLPHVQTPTLIVSGRHDFVTPASQGELMHSLLPNSQLLILEETAHFAGMEEQEEFFSSLKEFFS
ncbi:MAG: alpha/beta fold hydrolase [Candidatus Kariarchaeaceae archaeon]|jgi:proline iminopeptidase